MTPTNAEILPDEAQLALAYTPPSMRGPLRIFLELDMRLGRIVAATNEPMLGQMRLAWWRDTLGKPVDDRPQGDVVLDGIGEHWAGRESDLVPLVDGWEQLLSEEPLASTEARLFIEGRKRALMAVYGQRELSGEDWTSYGSAAWRWAVADLAANVSQPGERDMLIELGLANGRPNPRLPKDARGLAVLGALGWRGLKRGGRPLMEGRGASVVALRAAIFGR